MHQGDQAMHRTSNRLTALAGALAVALVFASVARAGIPGETGPEFDLTAKKGYISTPEANSICIWGFALGSGPAFYPGPTLIVDEGDEVIVNLTNELGVPVSITFPGQTGVEASGGAAGLLTREAPASGGTVTYQFTASRPGTYIYQSGTNPNLQIEMGLVGALVVRPATEMMDMPMTAYGHEDSTYDREYLLLETEMDPRVHELVDSGRTDEIDPSEWFPAYWFLNGRCAPDTMLPNGTALLPNQPYSAMVMMHPGERILLRFVSAGRDFHPFHAHGNNMLIIARDGRLESSGPGAGADLAESNFTITVPPGGTADAIFTWTGKGLGWDFYGHLCDRDDAPTGNFPGPEDTDHNGNGVLDVVAKEDGESDEDHGKPFPVTLPAVEDLTVGTNYSGSPFLGSFGFRPPGQGTMNPDAGYFFMWHSHREKEIVTNNVFPGGMMTMLLILPPNVPIMDM
jgi:FtsP/CotA-like multicopper oxidase with cupredoxin domain